MDSSEKNKKYKAILELEKNKEIKVLLKSIDNHKNEIHKLSKRKDYLWTAIHEKLRYSWTYNTNAIEGSTLSEGDTIFFLKEGLTVEGKPFKDFLDAKNHHEAIEFLYEVVKNSRSISESLIKEFNALLLSGVKYTKAINESGQQVEKLATPGKYKIEPNHVLQSDGTIHYYVEPIQVAPQMQDLVEWINDNIEKLHPVILGAAAHYDFVRIHPFDDGNGRGARLLMNLILIKKELPPAVIKNEKRRFYIESLIQADNGDLKSFVEFITSSLLNTQKMIIEAIKHDGENK